MPLDTLPFGPFAKGVIDKGNSSLDLTGALRSARNVGYLGAQHMSVLAGVVAAMTLLDDTRVVAIAIATRAATSATSTTLTDNTQAWTGNAYVNAFVEIISGTGAGQRATIVSNTATQVVISGTWATTPDGTSQYRIVTVTTPGVACTSVRALAPFSDSALAVGYSSVTQKTYLYRLDAGMAGWYDAGGLLHSTLAAEPVGTLWSAMTVAPDVTVAEGLGVAYIAHAAAADKNGLYWVTRTFDGTTLANLQANLDGGGLKDVYFCAVVSFQQHLWGAGFGTGNTAGTGYRPELARFSTPNFGAFAAADSITIGNRVRSLRERIVGLCVAGDALFLGSPYLLTRVTGFGRSSWYKKQLDQSHGVVGPKAMWTDGDACYYWTSRGPMRVREQGLPEPLWDGIASLVAQVVNPQTIVASRDETRNLVIFSLDIGTGTRTWCAFDVQREVWLGPDNDWGLTIACGGEVDPIVSSTATPPGGLTPSGPPTGAVTDLVGTTTARAAWTAGDATADTLVYLRRLADATATLVTQLPAGVASYTFSALDLDADYEWSVAHTKGGTPTATLGPSVATTFHTLASTGTLTAPSALTLRATKSGLTVSWHNSGEAGVSTDVEIAGPSSVEPPATDFVLQAVRDPGVASLAIALSVDGLYWVRIRHERSGAQPSAYVGPASKDVTITVPY